MKTYLVGGAVRDECLGLPVEEKDWVVVGSDPTQMQKLGFKAVGKDFPVFLHPDTHEEYALARTERKVAKGYKGFEFYTDKSVTLEADLLRRDLTINAMAKSADGKIIDPFNGQKDLTQKVLRHVSDAFEEDPVRILRVARFYARFSHLGFTIATDTLKLMRTMVQNGEVNALVMERVWQEFYKALTCKSPEKFIEALRACGALKILFPEIEALFGVPNKVASHPEIDTGIHTLMVLQQAVKLSEDPKVRFAALVHDLGKALTPMSEWPSHNGHEERGALPIKNLCQRLKVPKEFKTLAQVVGQYHDWVYKAFELKPSTILKLFEKTSALRSEAKFKAYLLACEADSKGRPGFENLKLAQPAYLLNALKAVKAVNIKALVDKGYQGEKLVAQIQQARIHALKQLQRN